MNKKLRKQLTKLFDGVVKREGGKSQIKRMDFHQAMKIVCTADAEWLANPKQRGVTSPIDLLSDYSAAILKKMRKANK